MRTNCKVRVISISNQKRILEAFAKQNGFTNLRWYTDDGFSGANFQRPGFQAMLADIEAGKVGTVIVKDMSRLGRNYLQVGFYTEMLFPQKGVRFIAVNDNVDSANGGMDNDFTPLRNLFNEWLVRDTSKKIKAVKRAKGMSGKPLPASRSMAISWTRTRTISLTRKPRRLFQQIYQLCLAGNGPTKIARMLTEQQIPTPGTLEYRRTGSTRRYHPGYECKWATNTVVHIPRKPGVHRLSGKLQDGEASYKVKHSVENPVEKQAIFENHHEPIIDRETWERVQELRKQRKRPNRYDEVGLFSGMLFCARLRSCDVPAAVSEQEPQAGLLHLRQLQEAHPRLYGALYPHRPVDRRCPLQSPASDRIRRQAREPLCEAALSSRTRSAARERPPQPPSSLNRRRSALPK